MTLDTGARLGTYEILGPLGAGGMGEVYRARDRKLGREVAIKVLSEAFASDASRVARFEREARMLAAVNHPAIAAIYGAEEDGDFRYIVMELVPGETLSEKLAVCPLPVPEALGLAAQIAEALSVAHEKGVIHRDLKPANIKVTPEGRVKVLDLGLAKAMEMEAPPGDISKSPTVVADDSRPGNLLGTPGFMSPEQARGKETDRRTDIWAFGCVLFEMLSGRRAFPGDSVPDILLAILDREPDWKALPAATPERVRELLRRCLEKDPSRRLRDAGDARLELEAALHGSAALRRAIARWKIAVALLASTAVVGTIFVARQKRAGGLPPMPERKQLALLPFENLADGAEWQRSCDGFVATVSARLQSVSELGVVTPVEFLRGTDPGADVYRVARSMGANLLLRGTFQREGDRVRVTWTALEVGGGRTIAAGTLEGPASDLFDLQDRFVVAVTKALGLLVPAPHTPTPGGLARGSEQQRYVEAMGLSARYDRESVEKALSILSGLASERPDAPLVHTALARACLALFDLTNEKALADRASAAAEAARKLDPQLTEVEVTLGETLLKTGRSKEAVEAFHRALSTQPDSYDALLGLGRSYGSLGNDLAAEQAFRQAINLQPLSWAGYSQLAAVYYRRGRYWDAVHLFRNAALLTPDYYRAWSNLGGALTMACDFVPALEAYQKALALRPDSPAANSNLGLNQLWTGHQAEAVERLEKAAKSSPNQFDIRGNLGDAYRAVRGQEAKATEAYTRSVALAREQLRLKPRDFRAQSFVATGLAKTGHPDEADKEMRRALDLAPKEPEILADAAVVAALAGRDSEALDLLKKAVAAGYCGAILARQPEFARLRDEPAFRSIVAAPREAAGS